MEKNGKKWKKMEKCTMNQVYTLGKGIVPK
jgi:hypothetical protein